MIARMQLWLWLTSSSGFTSSNGLNAFYESRISFPSNFLINWQTGSFNVRFPRRYCWCSSRKRFHKLRSSRCTSPLGCVSRVNKILSNDSLLSPSLMKFILSSRLFETIPIEWHCLLQVHRAHLWQTYSLFALLLLDYELLPSPGMYEVIEFENSLANWTFASIIEHISLGILLCINILMFSLS